jgi:succinate dehydrogenase hydrophobic anchor subunit
MKTENVKDWILKNWIAITVIMIAIAWFIFLYHGLTAEESQKWFAKSIAELTLRDLFLLIVLHAWIRGR